MAFTFEQVLGSFDSAAIVEGMAQRSLIHRPAACGVRPDALYSLEELERLLLRDGMDRNDLRVGVNGRVPDQEMLGVVKDQRLRPLVLRQLVRQGASIIVNNLHRHDPKFSALADDAERLLQDRIEIVAIASFSQLPALGAHYDPHDLIIVQVEGSKIWRFFGESADVAVGKHPRVRTPQEVSRTVTMHPGDVMFVPAGLHHKCEPEGNSLHLGFLIKHETIQDFLKDLFLQHPSLNRPLRPLLGREAVALQAAALKAELISLFDEAEVADWLTESNSARARVTSIDLRKASGSSSAEGIASLTVTMTPPGRAGRGWKAGGIDFKPGAGALAILSELRPGPLIVSELLDKAGREAGPDEARAGLDQLVGKGVVRIDMPAGADGTE